MPICSFTVDGEGVDLSLDRVPRAEEYASIFPEAKAVRLAGWRYSEDAGVPVGVAKWPIHSDAAGCHPNQISAMKKLIPDLDYTPDGKAIFKSAQHRRDCLKKLGMHDRAAWI
jgi:hypothetical protein